MQIFTNKVSFIHSYKDLGKNPRVEISLACLRKNVDQCGQFIVSEKEHRSGKVGKARSLRALIGYDK